MQFHRFTNGGFVAYKVAIPGNKHYFSVWGNTCGDMIDCEYAGGRAISRNARKLREDLARRCKAIHDARKGES